MAQFDSNINLDEIVPQGLQDESLALEMIKAGQEVLKSAIQSGASKHRKTGAMANSVKIGKAYINSNGDAAGKVNITGKDKDGRLNALKAMWIEFGTKHYPAQPFVRVAVKSSESDISAAMERVFKNKVGD